MDSMQLSAEQICVMLITHSNNKLGIPANNYNIIRLSSRLFGIIDFKVVESLVVNDYLTQVTQQGDDYCLTERGLTLLTEHKGQLLKYLQAEGCITNSFGHDMATHYIESI